MSQKAKAFSIPKSQENYHVPVETGNDLVDGYRLPVIFGHEYIKHRQIFSDRLRRVRKGVEIKRWKRIRELGRGAFGTVWLEQEQSGQYRALKEIRRVLERTNAKENIRELLAMAALSRDATNFVQLEGWFTNDTHIFIAMEYFELGDLENCIDKPLPEEEARIIIYQILEALSFMHGRNFTHRDLKPSNVFVVEKGPQWWVKLADFGVSKRVLEDDTHLHTSMEGDFVAPEVIGFIEEESSVYTNAVDMWSTGCIAHWLLTKLVPIPRRCLHAFCHQNRPLDVSMLQANNVSHEAIDFITKLLKAKASERMNAVEAMGHRWPREEMSENLAKTQKVLAFKQKPIVQYVPEIRQVSESGMTSEETSSKTTGSLVQVKSRNAIQREVPASSSISKVSKNKMSVAVSSDEDFLKQDLGKLDLGYVVVDMPRSSKFDPGSDIDIVSTIASVGQPTADDAFGIQTSAVGAEHSAAGLHPKSNLIASSSLILTGIGNDREPKSFSDETARQNEISDRAWNSFQYPVELTTEKYREINRIWRARQKSVDNTPVDPSYTSPVDYQPSVSSFSIYSEPDPVLNTTKYDVIYVSPDLENNFKTPEENHHPGSTLSKTKVKNSSLSGAQSTTKPITGHHHKIGSNPPDHVQRRKVPRPTSIMRNPVKVKLAIADKANLEVGTRENSVLGGSSHIDTWLNSNDLLYMPQTSRPNNLPPDGEINLDDV